MSAPQQPIENMQVVASFKNSRASGVQGKGSLEGDNMRRCDLMRPLWSILNPF